MHRVVIGDTPPEALPDHDPVIRMDWVDRHGVECQTVLVGTIARSISGVLRRAGLAESAFAYCSLVPFSESALFAARASGAGDYDLDAVIPRVGESRPGMFPNPWRKIVQRLRHWLTALG